MIETEKGKRIEQILATDVTREQLAEALWCAEDSQRMWHGCAEENRNFRLKAEDENFKLRELVRDVNRAAHMLCEAWEGSCDRKAEGMSLHAVCPIGDTNELCLFGKLYHRMRELGIEVD